MTTLGAATEQRPVVFLCRGDEIVGGCRVGRVPSGSFKTIPVWRSGSSRVIASSRF